MKNKKILILGRVDNWGDIPFEEVMKIAFSNLNKLGLRVTDYDAVQQFEDSDEAMEVRIEAVTSDYYKPGEERVTGIKSSLDDTKLKFLIKKALTSAAEYKSEIGIRKPSFEVDYIEIKDM